MISNQQEGSFVTLGFDKITHRIRCSNILTGPIYRYTKIVDLAHSSRYHSSYFDLWYYQLPNTLIWEVKWIHPFTRKLIYDTDQTS